MMGRTHIASGAAVWLTGCTAVSAMGVAPPPAVVLIGTPLCALSALLPDLDHQNSLIARSLGPVTQLVAWGIRSAVGHRGLTHTAACAAMVGVAATIGSVFAFGWSWWWLGLTVGTGHLAHIAGDACTNSGVPLLWPLQIRSGRWRMVGLWRPLRFRAGGKVEHLLVAPALILAGTLAAWRLLVA